MYVAKLSIEVKMSLLSRILNTSSLRIHSFNLFMFSLISAQTKQAEEEVKRLKASAPARPVIVTQPSAEVPGLQHTINLLK